MKCKPVQWLAIICLFIGASPASAWTTVGDGIEYQEYTVSGPNNIFVARMDRSHTNAVIESGIGQGRLSGGTERVSAQASRYNEAINYWDQIWGQRNDVVVAINGSYYNTTTGVPFSGVIHSGWYAKRYDNVSGQSGFVWQLDRQAYIGECVTHTASRQIVSYLNTGNTQNFHGINVPRSYDQLIIYTPQYDSTTLTDNTGVEVLVQLDRPMLLIPTPSKVTGVVLDIRENQGSTMIPFDHIVLSATGSRASTVLANVALGTEVGISQEIKSYERDCSTPRSLDWTKSYAAVSGNWVFLKDNVIQYGIDSSGARHPRTAIALNDSHVFFIVVDGRSAVSIGMTIDELAEFCRNTLSATWGLNQDGGGSSTMLVNGVIKNDPSDGSERAVSNSMMMINILPRTESTTFAPGNVVRINTANTAVRLGPGANHASIATLGKNVEGTVLDHPIKGIHAKEDAWWPCDFNDTVGWVAESLLDFVSGTSPPAIVLHPSDQTVLHGRTVSFTTEANGAPPLDYQWQKNGSDLSEGEHYAGVLTAELTVSSADKADEADYRCIVTNPFGSTPSDTAHLHVVSPDFDGDLDVDQTDFGYLQGCFGNADVSLTQPACVEADLNLDDDVDQEDFFLFQSCVSGAAVPPQNCAL